METARRFTFRMGLPYRVTLDVRAPRAGKTYGDSYSDGVGSDRRCQDNISDEINIVKSEFCKSLRANVNLLKAVNANNC
jgi:hypothetical protein